MNNTNRYKRAMDGIKPDGSFNRDTLAKLDKLRTDRKPAALRIIPAVSLLACALILALVVLPLRPAKVTDALPEPAASAVPYASAVPSESTEPAPAPVPVPAAEAVVNGGITLVDSFMSLIRPGIANKSEAVYEECDSGCFAYSGFNTEEYSAISESGFRSVLTTPLSTFAADVDTAGYTTVRRDILKGNLPDESAVRIEEMLNYFSYDGLAPQDDSPLAVSTSLTACPWNDGSVVLFVGIGAKAIENDELPPSNLVFLVDTSGSMDDDNKLGLIKQAFSMLTQNLRETDTVSIVTYAGSDRTMLEGVKGSERSAIMEAVSEMTAWGSTNGSAGINTAYNLAEKYFIEGGNNRVILMTDGDLNVGTTSEAALTELIEQKRGTGVFLSVYGFGSGNLKDNKLEALADHGNGCYVYVDSLMQAKRALVTEMGANFFTVCKDVKLQVEFNPAVIASYRLIGYENRALAAEDFDDDTKDGGEMGSGHTVVALYELIPAEGVTLMGVTGAESAQPALRYSAVTATGSDEVCTVSVRAKAPDSDESVLYASAVGQDDTPDAGNARNVRLACGIAEFGMVLRSSEYAGSATFDSAAELIRSLPGMNDDETELLYLITRAKQIRTE